VYAAFVPWTLGIVRVLNHAVFSSLPVWPATLGRFVAVVLVLTLPTLLMGATLPILVEALRRGREDVARNVGLLYGINTFGAVSGIFVATFVLLPAMGVRNTNLSAALVDIVIGLLALNVVAPTFAGHGLHAPPPAAAPNEAGVATYPARRNLAILSYAIVGFTALTYEVCWTRALAMVLGSSV